MNTFKVKFYRQAVPSTAVEVQVVTLPASCCVPHILSDFVEVTNSLFCLVPEKYGCRQFVSNSK